MNIGKYNMKTDRTVCKFNLQGMCRFGTRCWNLHSKPEKVKENQVNVKAAEPTQQDGACALSPTNYLDSVSASNKQNIYGPSTSTIEEAISLVKIAESGDKTCGICFDTILKKTVKMEQKFGILPNCNHCFCFTCIRKWRQSKEFDLDVSKACPECRIASDFVYPSNVWMETKDEKDRFIDFHKQRMKKLDCKYYRKGKGKCPFGNTCVYLHALPNGKVMDVGPPQPRRHRHFGNISEADVLQQILFWINDEEIDVDSDGDTGDTDEFELDLDDPLIAMQYYDHDDIRRYIAMDRLFNGSDDEDEFDMDL
ncbi:unnamed protein product [Phaedon cochleariae]|uniref:RING-type E3 ubiquitin transferase n=1 Tax=Phaedon cochleariae TaxID=80249 RepID=A0A9N9SK03_PHACE|nr:unnamed protein product [Phaedon cochleariae]